MKKRPAKKRIKETVALQAVIRKVRDRREELEWTQEEAAIKAGLSRGYVSLLESGKRDPTLSTMVALARALNVSLASLMPAIRLRLDPTA